MCRWGSGRIDDEVCLQVRFRNRSNFAGPLFTLVIASLIVWVLGAATGFAQEGATPGAATPDPATPVATYTPEEARFARLGGSLTDVLAEYGPPDWTDDGMLGYNSQPLGGIGTITMVFYDASERIRSFMLVYLERPAEFDDPGRIAAVVADVAPRDGRCSTTPDAENRLGDEVFVCKSEGLKGVFTPDDLLAFEVEGADGEYNYAVDPTDDSYFEIAVRLGSDGLPGPPTPVPTPQPTPLPPLTDTFPPVEDVATLVDGSIESGAPLSVTGTILDIRLTGVGATLVMDITDEEGESVLIFAENQDDLAGVYIGEIWTVYGVYTGFDCTDGCSATIQVVKLG